MMHIIIMLSEQESCKDSILPFSVRKMKIFEVLCRWSEIDFSII